MEQVWVIEFTAELPPVWIAEGGGLTYQRKKARKFATKEEAQKRFDELKMPDRWEVVPRVP